MAAATTRPTETDGRLVGTGRASDGGYGGASPGLGIKKTMTSLQGTCEEFLSECEAGHLETQALKQVCSRFNSPPETEAMREAVANVSRSQKGQRAPASTTAAARVLLRLQQAWSKTLQPSSTEAVGFLEGDSIRSCWARASAEASGTESAATCRCIQGRLANVCQSTPAGARVSRGGRVSHWSA